MVWLTEPQYAQVTDWLARDHFPWLVAGYTAIPQIAILGFLATLLVFVARLVATPSPRASGFPALLIGALLVLHYHPAATTLHAELLAVSLACIVTTIHAGYGMAFCYELIGLPARRALRGKGRPKRKPGGKGSAVSKPAKSAAKKVTVTISIGVAQHEDRFDSPDVVVKGADQALYRAKRAGRNRVSR